MRYWDSSALVPLLIEEAGSKQARAWLREDPTILTWVWSRAEITSSVERRVREGRVTRDERRAILGRLEKLAADWDEVVDILAVRTRANALLARHPLRAADAGQLGAALLACEGEPGTLTLVCLDGRFAEAGEREGLRVLSWSPGRVQEAEGS